MSNHVDEWSMLVTRVLAPNPGPMTLDGTNSYIVRHPGSSRVVLIDPGPRDSVHLRRLTRSGQVELVLLTHRHSDHADLAPRIHHVTGAPVRAADARLCVDSPPLTDGEVIHAGGTELRVVATPGHTADSVCFHLPRDRHDGGARGSLLTGDTILGRGATIIAPPDGALGAYFASLRRLSTYGSVLGLPAHGPLIGSLDVVVAEYIAHRRQRLRAVAHAAADLVGERPDRLFTVAAVTDRVYPGIAPGLRSAAEANVQAQLDYLAESAVEGFDPLRMA